MNEIPAIVIRLIESIFDFNFPDLISSSSRTASDHLAFQLKLFRLKAAMLSHISRMTNSVISISQKHGDDYLYSLSFSTPDVTNEQYAKRIELLIRPMWDGFDIYEIYKNSKKLVHEFKI